MDKLIMTIDFSGVVTKAKVLNRFIDSLKLTPMDSANWDGFYDYFTSLHTESEIVHEKKPKSLHLILKSIGDFEQACCDRTTTEYNTLINILVSATDKSQRYDGINFTFEIANDE